MPSSVRSPRSYRAIGEGRLDAIRAAVGHAQTALWMEFIAPRVASEVVVVVKDEDARTRHVLAIEIRRRETAHPRPDDDQVVALARVLGRPHLRPEGAIA